MRLADRLLISLESGLISFEMSDTEQIDIYLDRRGLADLLAQIKLLNDQKTDHVHLLPKCWGGSHLDEEPVDVSAKIIRHVKIIMRK